MNTTNDMLCCVVNGQTSICVTVTGVSIGGVATYSTSNNYCIDTLTMRTCTSDIMWNGTTPNATEGVYCSALVINIIVNFHLIFSACMRLSNKLSDWNTGLIAVGAILFVVGLVLAVVLVVLLVMRIKASCVLLVIRLKCAHHRTPPLSAGSVIWWYWVLLIASAVISLTSLALWIALGVYVSMNGESYHDSATTVYDQYSMFTVMFFFQTLLKERTQGSGVRKTHSVKLLLQTVSRLDWSLPAFCLLY